jgi:hypothetical protein
MAYICRCYIPHLLRRLTEEYNLYSSVIQLHSSIIADEYVMVSYSVGNISESST